MILTSKKFVFRTAKVTLEDGKLAELRDSGKYSSIIALSHAKMDIPGFVRTEKTTGVIDVSIPSDEIYQRFSEREKITKTYKDPDLKFVMDDQDNPDSYKIYRGFEYSQSRAPVSKKEFSQYRLFSAHYKGMPISGISIIESAPYIRIRSIFSKRLDVDDKAMYRTIANSSRRIMWELCQWAHAHGFVSIDLASVNVTDPAKKGISDFKMSFGGTIIPEYTYTYKSKAFASLEFLGRYRAALRKLFNR